MSFPRVSWTVLVGRNGAQLFYCFAGSALLNVVSQDFFARTTGNTKATWLSATLLIGTVASALGVPAAERMGLPHRPLMVALALVGAIAVLLGQALVVDSALYFAAVTIFLRFLLQYGTQEFDRRSVYLSGEEARRKNDVVGLGMRFGGMLLGPLWFSIARDKLMASLVVIAMLAVLGAWNAVLIAEAPQANQSHGSRSGTLLDNDDRLVLVAGRMIYAAYYLLASSVIYVLSDLHHVPSPVRRGGILVTLVYGSAIAIVIVEMLRRHRDRRSLLEMLPAAVVMALVGLALPISAARYIEAQVAGAILLGIVFARFQLAFRDHATYEAIQRQRPALLASFNNLGTISALVGYGVMALFVGVSQLFAVAYANVVGIGVALLGIGAIPFVVIGAQRIRHRPTNRAGEEKSVAGSSGSSNLAT